MAKTNPSTWNENLFEPVDSWEDDDDRGQDFNDPFLDANNTSQTLEQIKQLLQERDRPKTVAQEKKGKTPVRKDDQKASFAKPASQSTVPALNPALAISTSQVFGSSSFPGFCLEFDDGNTNSSEDFSHEMELLERYKKANNVGDFEGAGGNEEDGTWAGEAYEKVRPKYYDKVFKTFQKEVSRQPEQCLR
ncbi:hypothetical protein HDU96_005165 [Phlyctochytrium bullatum]|nr:hypothetical protein HDU96_005165 [Phlyctochytrium bullatum]